LNGESSPGILRGYADTAAAGTTSNFVSSGHVISSFFEDIVITAPGASGAGTIVLGFRVTADGTSASGSPGTVVQNQLWYYLGPDDQFQWTFRDITGQTVNTTLFGSPFAFSFGTPFRISAYLTSRVDIYCSTEAVCSSWNASGVSNVGNTLELLSLRVFDSNGNLVPNATASASSGTNFYNNVTSTVPEPSTWALAAGAAALAYLLRRSGVC
jgi:hypothetical protein